MLYNYVLTKHNDRKVACETFKQQSTFIPRSCAISMVLQYPASHQKNFETQTSINTVFTSIESATLPLTSYWKRRSMLEKQAKDHFLCVHVCVSQKRMGWTNDIHFMVAANHHNVKTPGKIERSITQNYKNSSETVGHFLLHFTCGLGIVVIGVTFIWVAFG